VRRSSQKPGASSQEKTILCAAALCGLLFGLRKGLRRAGSGFILATVRRSSQKPGASSQEKTRLRVAVGLCGLLFGLRKGLRRAGSGFILAPGSWLLATAL
jgi:hypothetical protein